MEFRVNTSGKRRSLIVVEVEEFGTRLMYEYVQGIMN
jgi:hypothetical protein